MIEILQPGFRTGAVHIPASKSQAHRLLICAALSQNETVIRCRGISRDIAATADCLNALGAEIWLRGEDLTVRPITQKPQGTRHLHCQESGSTLRFLLPLTGVLEADAVFHMEGRLPQRPLHPLDQVLTDHGMTIRQNHDLLYCGRQRGGRCQRQICDRQRRQLYRQRHQPRHDAGGEGNPRKGRLSAGRRPADRNH